MSQHLAVVTGATGGIGGAIVHRLLVEDYEVIAVGRARDKLIAVARHARVFPFQIDLAEVMPDFMQACFEGRTKQIDLLVCAHGHAPVLEPSVDLEAQTFRDVYETDVLGTLRIAQAVYPRMREQGGNMVFVSSLHAKQTYPARAAYCSAKAAVCSLARTLALEWGPQGIRVNTVLPWQVAGPRGNALAAQAAASGEDLIEAYKQRSPLRQLIQPDEVAEAVLFLAKNRGMNGAELVLDGGTSASMWYRGFMEA